MAVEKDIGWYRDRAAVLSREIDELLGRDPPPMTGDPEIFDRLAELGLCKRAIAGLEAKIARE